MSIKGYKDEDVISKYDHRLKAFHEVPIEEIRKELQSFGFSEQEIEEKIRRLKEEAITSEVK